MTWTTEIKEISNNVYRLKMIHPLGSTVEKTGTDIETMKKEALKVITRIEKEIKEKLKN